MSKLNRESSFLPEDEEKNAFKKYWDQIKILIKGLFANADMTNQQLRYLSQASVLEEASLPYNFKFLMIVITSMAVIAITWGSIAKVKEVAKTTGEIIPSTPIQVIQHQEGGTVSEILVLDGSKVHKNQLLLKLAGNGVRAELERARTKDLTLRVQAERYSAFANFSEADFEQFKNDKSSLANEQRKILESMIENRDKQKSVIEEQLRQKKENLKMTKSKIATLEKNLKLTKETFQTKLKLFKGGYMQKSILLDAEKELNTISGELDKSRSEQSQNEQGIIEFESRLNSLESGLKDEALQKLSTLQGDIAENAEVIKKLQDQIDRLEIRSPITGIVKGEEVTTIGGVIGAGQKIMEIIPTEGKLLAEIKIAPSDIGNIKVGQPCLVKVTAFDFSRFGGIDGTLKSVSATTFVGKDGIPYYKGRVRLKRNYIGDNPDMNVIIPGNIVETDIIIGSKTIMASLLKPIQIALNTAFTEH